MIVHEFLGRYGDLVGVTDTATLSMLRVLRLGPTTVVRLRQTIEGAPVVGAHLTALLDQDGRIRLMAQSLADPSQIGPVLVEPQDAAIEAASRVARPAAQPSADHAALVYIPTVGGVRPAYAVTFGAVPALLANWYVLIDASTGEVISRFNQVLFDRTALVWPENPTTSELSPVSLDTLVMEGQACIGETALPPAGPDGEAVPDATTPRLCTERISARTCWDHHETMAVELPMIGLTDLHTCTEYHMVVPNDAPDGNELPEDDDLLNDFFLDDSRGELDYDYAGDELAGQDLFAEVNVFHHTELMYDYFRAFDPDLFTGLRLGQLLVSTNWRIPIDITGFSGGVDLMAILAALTAAQDPEGELFPFDNAMYVPSGNLFGVLDRPLPSLMFFQGNHRDFAYDSDVIYHEFTHAVVGSVVDGIGLGLARRDAQGMHLLSTAMNEAYADFFATAYNGNAEQGEYAMGGPGMPGPRDLAARPRHSCPERLSNEEHVDSAPYSEALWEIREALDPEATEHAVFAGLCSLTPDASFRDGAAATVTAIEAELGADNAATARTIFAQYGFDDETDCERVVDLALEDRVEMLVLFGTEQQTMTLSPFAPSVVQYRVDIPEGTRQLIVHYLQGMGMTDLTSLLDSGEALPGLLIRAGDEPIEFPATGEVSTNADLLIDGDEADPAVSEGRRIIYHLDGESLPTGPHHIMLVNSGTVGSTLVQLWVEASEEPPETETTDGDADADADGDGDADADGDGDGDGDADADADGDGDGDADGDAGSGGCDCGVTAARANVRGVLELLAL